MAESESEEFFDCRDVQTSPSFNVARKKSSNHVVLSSRASASAFCIGNGTSVNVCNNKDAEKLVSGGRCHLPHPMSSHKDISIWGILKHCIGKELSKITMPVVFNEPLSFLQRVAEYMEYSDLLRKASECSDPVERHELVTAFAVSASASNLDRVGKPFNPLLGETYELNSEDLGFKMVCEQVSHHPPISAFHVDSPLYSFHGSIHPKLKFWGKSVEVTPKGLVTLYLKRHDEAYSWQFVNCCVHNIVIGKLWIEHYGVMEVTNHKTNWKSILNFRQSGWFGKDIHKIFGHLLDKNKQRLRTFYGKWTTAFFSYDTQVWDDYQKLAASQPDAQLKPGSGRDRINVEVKSSIFGRPSLPKAVSEPVMSTSEELPGDVIVNDATCDLNLPGQKVLWTVYPKPPDHLQYYSFTLFAMMLNELDDQNCRILLAPTDARLRPDIRLMEEGRIDEAAAEKDRLEEKQRAARKERKKRKIEPEPAWFKLGKNLHTGKEDWLFTGEYWKRNWKNCPDIF